MNPQDVHIEVTTHDGYKCPRCWHYHHVKDNHDHLCDRCCHVLIQHFPDHESIPHIKKSFEMQKAKYSQKKVANENT